MTDQTSAQPQKDFRHRVMFVVTVVAVIAVLLILLASVMRVVPLIFISILIAVFLRSIANPIGERIPLSGRWVVLLVTFILIGLLVAFIVLAGPAVFAQFDQLVQRMPEAINSLESNLQQYGWGQTLLDSLNQIPSGSGTVNLFSSLTGIFTSAFGAFTNVVLILIAGIYMAFEPSLYVDNLVRLFPPNKRDRTRDILNEGYHIVRLWLFSRLMSMLVVGILSFVGLMIIDMPLALSLAVIAGLLSFIPNLGPILAAIPAILVGLTQSIAMALLAALVYFIVQQIENYLITPNIQRQTVSLPPAVVMLSQILLALMFGWLGLFIAAPLVAFGIVLVKSVYVEDFLGDHVGKIVQA